MIKHFSLQNDTSLDKMDMTDIFWWHFIKRFLLGLTIFKLVFYFSLPYIQYMITWKREFEKTGTKTYPSLTYKQCFALKAPVGILMAEYTYMHSAKICHPFLCIVFVPWHVALENQTLHWWIFHLHLQDKEVFHPFLQYHLPNRLCNHPEIKQVWWEGETSQLKWSFVG